MRDDGAGLLSSDAVGDVLEAAVAHAGGALVSWALDHIDADPHRSTTATYSAIVDWAYGRRDELLGVSARANGLSAADARAEIFADGEREVAVWLYPNDPDLPGLARAAYPESVCELIAEHGLVQPPPAPSELSLEMIGYRPRRRAVLKAVVRGRRTMYVKVLREATFAGVRDRHTLLAAAGVPAPRVLAATDDRLLVLDELPGTILAKAIFTDASPCTAGQLIDVLDAMPAAVSRLERRAPWAASVEHYATMVASALPAVEGRLAQLCERIRRGLEPLPLGDEPTHGDFHEGQIHVFGGRVVGVLDVDTIGPGRRADDLACLIAHRSTIQRMNAEQAARLRHLLRSWVPVFDTRVDPVELRLRTAAVVISLATGPYRGQEPGWEQATSAMIDAAEALVRQVS